MLQQATHVVKVICRKPKILAAGHPLFKRLPQHYINYLLDMERPSERVHDIPQKGDLLDYKIADERTLRIERVADVPIRVDPLHQSDEGIWAGEGLIRGFMYPHRHMLIPFGYRRLQMRLPNLQKAVVYSEILDKYLIITTTKRALAKIDEAYGFDGYILRTPVQDLKSQLALDLRRKLLVTLAKNSYYPNDPIKHKEISEKFKDCVLPLEEADWIGLPLSLALHRVRVLESLKNRPEPMRVQFAKELIAKLDVLKAKGELPAPKKNTDEIGGDPGFFGRLFDKKA